MSSNGQQQQQQDKDDDGGNNNINNKQTKIKKKVESSLTTTSNRPPIIEPKPKLTKAERREIQEKQRAEKAARMQGGGGGGATTATSSVNNNNNNNNKNAKQPPPKQPSKGDESTKSDNKQQQQQQQQSSTSSSKNKTEKQSQQQPTTTTTSPVGTLGGNDTCMTSSSSSSLVSHLSMYNDPTLLFDIGATIRTTTSTNTDTLHPLVIQTGYWYATGQIRGGNARCRAMLRCYLRLIRDFVPPSTTSSTGTNSQQNQRGLQNNNNTKKVGVDNLRYIVEQNIFKVPFQYWTEFCRIHSVSMGNAFTFIKTAISSATVQQQQQQQQNDEEQNDRIMTWEEMSTILVDIINAYERERIDLPDVAIGEITCAKVLFPSSSTSTIVHNSTNNTNQHQYELYNSTKASRRRIEGDVFLTFGDSEAVRAVFHQAVINNHHQQQQQQNKFRVIVVDSRPLLEGRTMIQYLRTTLNIDCTYCLLSSVTYVLKDVTKVIIGASALSSDGSVFGRVGTAVVAMAAYNKHIPVIVCCETYKISNRVFTGSITNNEVGNPNDICTLGQASTTTTTTTTISGTASNTKKDQTSSNNNNNTINNNVHQLNLLYDLTPAQFVSGIVTELGILPPTSIAVLLREMNPQDLCG